MLDRIFLYLWAVRAWWIDSPPVPAQRVVASRLWPYAITWLLLEFAIALRIIGLMAPLPVQWQWS